MLSAIGLVVAVIALLVLFRPPESEKGAPVAPAPVAAALGPLAGPVWSGLDGTSSLADAAEGSAKLGVWAPVGAEKPRPVVVLLDATPQNDAANLGAQLFDRLEHDVFVMVWSGPAADTRSELRAGLERLKARFGGHVAPGAVLLVSTAPYGVPAAALLREDPSFFSRGLLFDFDSAVWSSTLSVIFGQRGGKRLVFAVSDPEHQAGALQAATGVRRTGAEGRVVPPTPLEAAQHRNATVEAAFGELRWLLEGDARFPAVRSVPPPAPPPPVLSPAPSAPALPSWHPPVPSPSAVGREAPAPSRPVLPKSGH